MNAETHLTDSCTGSHLQYFFQHSSATVFPLLCAHVQSKPLMELQEDTDPVTKEHVLTCVLLPQNSGQSQSMGRFVTAFLQSLVSP